MRPVPPDLAPELIRSQLRSRVVGRALRVLPEVGSTNDLAVEEGRQGGEDGLVILADRQTAGRGRRGRSWTSPAGVGLYTSVLLRPEQPPARLPLLTLVAGLATGEAIEEAAGVLTRLKWPNDVLVGGRKVAGILTEVVGGAEQVSHVVVGIGINVNHGPQDLPAALFPAATSLYLATGRTVLRGQLAAALYSALDRWYQVFSDGGDRTILAAGRERSAILGQTVDVFADERQWQGLAVDLDADGALLVKDEGGALRRIVAADVSIRSA